jgi:acyl-coenzyme A thioesterase PaaI-like protein
MTRVLLDHRWSAMEGVGGEHAHDAWVGLRLRLATVDERELRATFLLEPGHQGALGRAHGGALTTALDEVLGRVAWLALDRHDCLTAYLNCQFRRPAPVGAQLEVVGRLVRREGRKLWLAGEVLHDGLVVCEAEGLWLSARESAGGASP